MVETTPQTPIGLPELAEAYNQVHAEPNVVPAEGEDATPPAPLGQPKLAEADTQA